MLLITQRRIQEGCGADQELSASVPDVNIPHQNEREEDAGHRRTNEA
jgi:hypothetical protein